MANDSINIKADQISEESVHVFVTEASTIGLKPGEWPEYIFVIPKIGNGRVFRRAAACQKEDEVQAIKYLQQLGCVELVVLND